MFKNRVDLREEINNVRQEMFGAIRRLPANSVFLRELSKGVDALDGLEKYLYVLEKSEKNYSPDDVRSHLSIIFLNFSSKVFLYSMMSYECAEEVIAAIINPESENVVNYYDQYTFSAIMLH